MKKFLLVYFLIVGWGLFACSGSKSLEQNNWKNIINDEATTAASQYKFLANQTPESKMPKTFYSSKTEWEFSNTAWWTSGFFPGTLFYMYELTGDKELWEIGTSKLKILEKEKNNKGTHDLGFMLFCSFGNADRINANEDYKKILLIGAESLYSRFNSKAGVLRSWDHGPWKFPVIIDNMMNLELLFWASEYSGDPKYKEIAIIHANQTIKNHYRKNSGSYHVVDYDPSDGRVLSKQTAQGLHDDSAWSRGQAWGLYGFTTMYRLTKDDKYLQQAIAIADFILNHPNLPEDLVPFWDFDVDRQEHKKRDVSAASITASALLELATFTDKNQTKDYLNKADIILKNLSSVKYRAQNNEEGGFLLKHSIGHFKANSEVDVPLTYADYYYIEALWRLKNWYL